MQHLSGRRALALVAALALGTAGSALAQDTTDMGRAPMDTTQPAAGAIDTAGTDTSAVRDTTDTSGVVNPQGYRGMERDTTRIPAQRGTSDSLPSDSAASGNGDGYRTERPPAADSTQ
jgi:uncharacterized protein involved in copper resistance